MELFYKPMVYFVGNPRPAFWIAGFFLLLLIWSMAWGALNRSRARQARLWPLLLPLGVWAVYAAWESSLVGKGYNVRVDLLAIYPVLVVSTIVGLVLWARGFRNGGGGVSASTCQKRSKALTAVSIVLMVVGGWNVWSTQWVVPAMLAGLRDEKVWQTGYGAVALLQTLDTTVVGGLGSLLGGIGVWQFQRWARVLVLWIAATALLWGLCKGLGSFAIVARLGTFKRFGLVVGFPILWSAFLLWFFTRRSTTSQFQRERRVP